MPVWFNSHVAYSQCSNVTYLFLQLRSSLFLYSLKRLLSYKVMHGLTPCHLLPFPPAMENEKFYISLSIRLKTIN